MLGRDEWVNAVLVPLVVSALVAGLGWWRSWAWRLPTAIGAGFMAGYSLLGVPELPPQDGTDWLYWLGIPLTTLGIVDAMNRRKVGHWLAAGASGAAALLLLWPLVPRSVTVGALVVAALAFAGAAGAVALAVQRAERFMGPSGVIAGLAITVAGASILVLSSNLRIVGIYGLAAASALAPVGAFAGARTANQRLVGSSVATVTIPLLAGLLVAGRYYPDPGINWGQLVSILGAPALLALAIVLRGQRRWLRISLPIFAVAVAVATVSVSAAYKALKASAADPY